MTEQDIEKDHWMRNSKYDILHFVLFPATLNELIMFVESAVWVIIAWGQLKELKLLRIGMTKWTSDSFWLWYYHQPDIFTRALTFSDNARHIVSNLLM